VTTAPQLSAGPLADRRWSEHEWLVTDGLGGFASGTILGVNTRRQHGFFVPNLREPNGRFVVISRLEVAVPELDTAPLFGGIESDSGSLATAARQRLTDFRLDNHVPVWHYEIAGRVLEQRIVAAHQLSVVCCALRLVAGEDLEVRLRPWIDPRRIDAGLDAATPPDYEVVAHGARRQIRCRRTAAQATFTAIGPHARYDEEQAVSQPLLLRTERARGYDHVTRDSSPGCFVLRLAAGEQALFVATSEAIKDLADFGATICATHAQRIDRLVSLVPRAAQSPRARELIAAADQFIVIPGGRRDEVIDEGREPRSIIAGYPWFSDWGRDTMISLPGLALATNRHLEAREILRTFSTYLEQGLIPNLFPEGDHVGVYNTVDAPLWYLHAIDRYLRASGVLEFVAEHYPQFESIIDHHVEGTKFGIGIDPADGLLRAAAPGLALTWMDARFEGRPVTPRAGKPVEIQALWYNALRTMAAWARELGHDAGRLDALADRVRAAFNVRFWNRDRACLLDLVDGETGDDASCRPNQIFAISLPHAVLEEARWRPVLDCVERELLTPYGLRTLSRDHPDYHARYEGDLAARDAAYHQGTAWPWLMGPFIDAWLRVHSDRQRAFAMLQPLVQHLAAACVGTVSEIFDADPPHRARGCFAQAWSVAELLRAWLATDPEAETRTDD
jgi:predicted glycogen debranching enzyme